MESLLVNFRVPVLYIHLNAQMINPLQIFAFHY